MPATSPLGAQDTLWVRVLSLLFDFLTDTGDKGCNTLLHVVQNIIFNCQVENKKTTHTFKEGGKAETHDSSTSSFYLKTTKRVKGRL